MDPLEHIEVIPVLVAELVGVQPAAHIWVTASLDWLLELGFVNLSELLLHKLFGEELLAGESNMLGLDESVQVDGESSGHNVWIVLR